MPCCGWHAAVAQIPFEISHLLPSVFLLPSRSVRSLILLRERDWPVLHMLSSFDVANNNSQAIALASHGSGHSAVCDDSEFVSTTPQNKQQDLLPMVPERRKPTSVGCILP